MEQMPIGMIIKQIVHKKNLSTSKLAAKLELSRQGVYNTYLRTSMHEGELERWSKALGISVEELMNPEPSKTESQSYGDEVLNNIRRMLEEELKEKNEQIKRLQNSLEQALQLSSTLLGKSHEYPNIAMIPSQHNGSIMYGPIR